jgi:hypothetical protein
LTIAKRPSCGTGWVGYRSDWVDPEGKYFCRRGLDRANQLDPAWEFSFYALALWGAEGAQKLPDGQISLVMTMDCFAAFVHARVGRACRTLKRDVQGGRFFLRKKMRRPIAF